MCVVSVKSTLTLNNTDYLFSMAPAHCTALSRASASGCNSLLEMFIRQKFKASSLMTEALHLHLKSWLGRA